MKRIAKKLFQEFVDYIDFPTMIYFYESGKIFAINEPAKAIIGAKSKEVAVLLENQERIRFNREILDYGKELFYNKWMCIGEEKWEVDFEINCFPLDNQHIVVCFFEQSYKQVYVKHLSVQIPRMFLKDADLNFLSVSHYFMLDANMQNHYIGKKNDSFLDPESSEYIDEIEREIMEDGISQYNMIHTMKVIGRTEYFVKTNRMRVIDRNGKGVAILGVYSLILNRNEYKGMLDATLRENGILNQIFWRSGLYIFSWKLVDKWPVEYVSPNFSVFGYTMYELYSGKVKWKDIIHPDDWDDMESAVKEFIQNGSKSMKILSYRIKKADGQYVWIKDETFNISMTGEQWYREGVITDINEKKILL
ncbi:PAS domain-containing protein [Anaeromicropila populeti]|uniref:histidine kinase n=1 Tax=Anaeromicropila populeti TaxID=37658 RepID=A0A1I6JW77_9FIRM|nr:PAS domain-containing protein [Anaeromicropila populeti]SFR83171.1 PAS domain S-box-containing protein [Anaeromicropila populeti]